METRTAQQNKMAVMPIPKLLLNMAVPLMISLIVQALYNLVDSLFLSSISENVLTAVSLAATLQHLLTSVATGIGVGMTSVVARELGAKKREKASSAAWNGIFVSACMAAVAMVAAAFLLPWYFRLQTQDEQIIGYGVSYMRICMFCSLAMFLEIAFERLLNATGKNTCTMIAQFIGAVVNIALDPLFIFTMGLGIRGAAFATVIGQSSALLVAVFFNLSKNKELDFSPRLFRINTEEIRAIFRVGVPTIAMSGVGTIMGVMLNSLVTSFSTSAMAAYGVYNRLQRLSQAPNNALAATVVPVVAYNFGAGNRKRVVDTVKWGIIYIGTTMTLCCIWFNCLPEQTLSLFHPSQAMLEAGIPILRIIGFTYLMTAPTQTLCSAFQGLGHGTASLMVTLSRQLLVRLPLAYLFAYLGGLNMLWLCWPVSEFVSNVVAFLLAGKLYKKEIRPLGE